MATFWCFGKSCPHSDQHCKFVFVKDTREEVGNYQEIRKNWDCWCVVGFRICVCVCVCACVCVETMGALRSVWEGI